MYQIKHIYAIGSSFTAGGGFEEGSWVRKKMQEFIDEPLPEKMSECAWPHFLSKSVKSSIEIINDGVPGAGIEHLIRRTNEWIRMNPIKSKNTLFLLEVTGYGRNEFWSTKYNRPLQCNWDYGVRKKGFTGTVHTGQYWKDTEDVRQYLENEASRLMERWMDEFVDVAHEWERLQTYLFNFLTYMKYKGYEFKIFGEDFIDINYQLDPIVSENKLHLITKTGKTAHGIYHFLEEDGLQIKQFTDGKCDDFHATLEGNKIIANQYYNQLVKKYNL